MEITLGFCFKGHVLEGSHQPLDKVGNMSVNSEARAELRTSPNISTYPKYYVYNNNNDFPHSGPVLSNVPAPNAKSSHAAINR